MSAAILAAHAVTKSFGSTPALRDANLTVTAGEVLAIMGPSGSGKSTLLHCLAGILRPDSGQIVFDGHPLNTMSENNRSLIRRDRFGFVFQFGQLVPELPVLENVMLPLLLRHTSRRVARDAATAVLDRLDLHGLHRRRPGELSGGQAQRVAVARALVNRPTVVFADEPTGSLDSLAGENVMDLLLATAREQNATVVLVTHDARVAACADREVLVRDGEVTDYATVETNKPGDLGTR
ncbi:putative ABC transport system ATP-binding protein [Asanoa ferruginea]|uniref:Putative ABC transport system ATP-binding protein n=1 Tax=Asanoa ferruginea TaxID=53367 RepID=A0A3D9ZWF4_9ACTN|nr:ABC transporter ATP-binding protein [Asanoa ferruginea]REG00873.1 putative ABC transport system ATP-binding protein [Asanoa ferruginea]GIF47252.1 ABC transporter ATP-binding protein [Asanoa ferruginea]